MTCLAIIGIPRTDHVLVESVVQARLRGLDVVLLDRPSRLAHCPEHLPLAGRVALERDDADHVVARLAGLDPGFVVSFSEFSLLLAAQVRQLLGLPGPGVEAVQLTRCKHATRQCLHRHGLTHIAFETATLDGLERVAARFTPPFIIKPASLTGSIGVQAIRRMDEVRSYMARFVSLAEEETRHRLFVVEQFIEGKEYSVEGVYGGGFFHLFSITEKRTSGFPYFAETGHLVPGRAPPGADCAGFIAAVAAALGLDNSPIHAEIKVVGDKIELIEIHARFAGDYIPLLIEEAFGYKVFGAYYDILLGRVPAPMKGYSAVAGIHFLHEEDVGTLTELPVPAPDIDCRISLAAAGRGAEADLDNVRILHRRIGHILFRAPDHASADLFAGNLEGALREGAGVRAGGVG